ncbi:MAG: hypothetical protein AAFQ74_03855 [Cyanobacteria bacterium J06623_4]
MKSDYTPNQPSPHHAQHSLESEFYRLVRTRARQSHSQRQLSRQQIREIISQITQQILAFLTGQTALSIRKQLTPDGHCQWIIYNPQTNTRHTFESERAVRIWLEQRHLR